jgi:hypothetical protein
MKHKLILTLFCLSLIVVANAQNIGIGTTTPNAFFNVAAGQTVLFGTDTTSAENKLMWLPANGAFRAGYYFGAANPIGLYSTAIGHSVASGNYSTAMGSSTASGTYSTAMGFCSAYKYASTAMGYNSIANGEYSTAMGYSTTDGEYSTVMGNSGALANYATAMGNSTAGYSTPGGDYSTAMGHSTAIGEWSTAAGYSTASGIASTAMGYNSAASADYSTAMGYNNVASGQYSTVMGGFNVASGNYSTAMGAKTVAKSGNETVIGTWNDTSNTNRLFEIGDGTFGALSNAITVLNNGDVYLGTVNPTHKAKLVVQGNEAANITYAYYALNGTSVFDGTSSDASAPLSIWASDRISASEFDATSDMRIKRDIKPLSNNSLDILAKINVVSYAKFSKGGVSKEIGVIGQELENVLPQAVKKGDGEVYNDTTQKWEPVKDFRSVNYQTIGMITTKAVQELSKKADNQQAMVEALQKQNTALQQNNLALQQQMQTLLNTVVSLNKQVQALATKANNQTTVAVNK